MTCRAAFLLALAVLVGCKDSQSLSALIQTHDGVPIPGAVLYAEAYDNDGAFDFVFAIADKQGRVPAADTKLVLEWRRGAKLALAAFAPGMRPLAVYDQLGRIKGEGITLALEPSSEGGLPWEPRVGQLSYPFERHAALAERLRGEDTQLLRAAFIDAYEPLVDGRVAPSPRELRKIAFMRALQE